MEDLESPALQLEKQRFIRSFHTAATIIQDLTSKLSTISTTGGERQDATDQIITSLARLSEDVRDAADFMPAYDQRVFHDTVAELHESLNRAISRNAPRARFQFKTRAGSKTAANAQVRQEEQRHLQKQQQQQQQQQGQQGQQEQDPRPSASASTGTEPSSSSPAKGAPIITNLSRPAANELSLSDHDDQHLVLPIYGGRAAFLTRLSSCVVELAATTFPVQPAHGAETKKKALASLAVRDAQRTLLVVDGRVEGPVHVTGVQNAVLVLAATRQVRIHGCVRVDVYLHCESHPVIEDCSEMRFAPVPGCFAIEGVDAAKNQWKQVDDFKWLKADHSPNWNELPEGERLPDEVWKSVRSGMSGASVEKILKKVGFAAQ